MERKREREKRKKGIKRGREREKTKSISRAGDSSTPSQDNRPQPQCNNKGVRSITVSLISTFPDLASGVDRQPVPNSQVYWLDTAATPLTKELQDKKMHTSSPHLHTRAEVTFHTLKKLNAPLEKYYLIFLMWSSGKGVSVHKSNV